MTYPNAGMPKKIDNLLLGDYGASEFLHSHKAAMFKPDDSLLAFSAELTSGVNRNELFAGALFISYKNNKLAEYGRIQNTKDFSTYGNRLLYIGNTLYFIENGWLRSFDLATLNPLQSLMIR